MAAERPQCESPFFAHLGRRPTEAGSSGCKIKAFKAYLQRTAGNGTLFFLIGGIRKLFIVIDVRLLLCPKDRFFSANPIFIIQLF